jgi:hypothetical protein
VSTENVTEPTEPQEPTAADFEPTDEEVGQEQTASSESASADQETESQEAGEGEQTDADEFAEPPAYWSAERKSLWNKEVPKELRQAIHEHEREAARAINGKLMEAAEKVKDYETNKDKLAKDREAAAAYWQSPVAVVEAIFNSRWGSVDLAKIAQDNPAEAVRLRELRDQEAQLVGHARANHDREMQAVQERSKAILAENKRTEHEKLAARLPDFAPDKAQATYDELGSYLTKTYKFAPERINAMYEADVIEIAHKAMLYDKAQAKLRAQPKTAAATATQTPTRVAPGARQGQPNQSEALRQAEKRLRTGQNLSDDDVERLFG